MKSLIRFVAGRFGKIVVDQSRIGIELENDLVRLGSRKDIRVVWDVGGNVGQSAIRFRKAFKNATIYSFEPVSSNYEILQKRCKNHSSIKPFRIGLGSSDGEVAIGLSDHAGGHSMLLGNSGNATELVTVMTIDHLRAQMGIPCIDLLKIDVEGFELQVLRGGESSLKNGAVRYLYLECVFSKDSTAPHTEFREIQVFLEDLGYSFFAAYHESFYLASGAAMANVLFVNQKLLPSEVNGRVRNIV